MPGVLIINAGVDSPVFNAAMLSAPLDSSLAELDRRIAIAKVYFQARDVPWSFWVCRDLAGNWTSRRLDRVFENRGLRRTAECPGMMAECLPPPDRPLPVLDIREVDDAETRLAFCHITTVCFRIPFATSIAIYNSPETWRTSFKAYVAYSGGEPVTTAATVGAAGAVGLYSVATLPERQGRGIAEQLTRAVLDRARQESGLERMVLQSTRQGASLYQRLGFREVTKIAIYVAQ